LLNINEFFTLGLSGLVSGILVIFTGDYFGIRYREIIKSVLFSSPGASLLRRFKEKMA